MQPPQHRGTEQDRVGETIPGRKTQDVCMFDNRKKKMSSTRSCLINSSIYMRWEVGLLTVRWSDGKLDESDNSLKRER